MTAQHEAKKTQRAYIEELETLQKAKRCRDCAHSLALHTFGSDGYGDHCNVDDCYCIAMDTEGW